MREKRTSTREKEGKRVARLAIGRIDEREKKGERCRVHPFANQFRYICHRSSLDRLIGVSAPSFRAVHHGLTRRVPRIGSGRQF